MENWRKRAALGLMLAVCGAFAAGCGEKLQPQDVVRAHFDGLNREDLDAAMSYIEPGPNYDATRPAIEQSFKTYDLRYTVEKVEILDAGRDEWKLRVTQTTKKVSGPMFVDNRVTAVWTLKSDWRGVWKIASTEVKDIEQL